jgi:hypothetical protein
MSPLPVRDLLLDLVQSRVDSLGGHRQRAQLTPDGVGDGMRDGGGRGVVGPFPHGLGLIRSLPAAGRHEDRLEGWEVRDRRPCVGPSMAVQDLAALGPPAFVTARPRPVTPPPSSWP